MKQLKNFLILLLFVVAITLNQCRLLNSNKATCSISSINIPIGSNSPVMVYNARIEDENLQLTVLDKSHSKKYKVDGNLFYSDKKTGESWYSDKDMSETNMEAMRDAFSLCRTLNTDNKQTKVYEKSRLYKIYRTESIPNNVQLRISNEDVENSNSNKMSSFLQMGQSYIDSKMEKDLEDLEKDESPDLVADQYKNLNNDANELNEKLQRQLAMDNGAIPTSTADLYVD